MLKPVRCATITYHKFRFQVIAMMSVAS
jgi:hypothetical protein